MRNPEVWITARKGKRGVTYHLRWLDPTTGRWRSESCGKSKRRAEASAARKRQDLAAGINGDMIRVAWPVFCDRVLAAKAISVRASTLAEIRRTLDMFTEVIQPVAPDRVQHADVQAFLEARKAKGNSSDTLDKHRRNLRNAFNEGIRLRLLRENPTRGVAKFKTHAKDWHLYDPTEVDAMIAAAGRLWGPMIYVAYTTAMRKGEALNLTWADVDFDAKAVKVKPKAGSGLLAWSPKDHEARVLPLTDDAARWLQRLYVASDKNCPYVFIPPDRYRYLVEHGDREIARLNNFDRTFARICSRAGVVADGFHSLRKSCITRWLESGVRPHVVQSLAGHADIQTTMRYYSKVRGAGIESARVASATYHPGAAILRESCASKVG